MCDFMSCVVKAFNISKHLSHGSLARLFTFLRWKVVFRVILVALGVLLVLLGHTLPRFLWPIGGFFFLSTFMYYGLVFRAWLCGAPVS